MDKTLLKIGVGLWGLLLLLSFIIGWILGVIGVSCEESVTALLPLGIIEIIAFIITLYGLLDKKI